MTAQHKTGCPATGGYGHGAEECICSAAQDQQSRAEFEDGKWYWVEHEGWGRAPSIIAPARYRADCDAWYSFEFSGISTRFLKVLGPCELQAARALPAPVICYVRPGATLPRRMGWETCAATDAGALAVHADGRALSACVGPVAWTVAGDVTNWARDFSKYKTQHYVQPVFTASQVQAMGRVPPGWQAVPLEPTGDMLMAIMSPGEVDVLRETPERHQVLLIDRAGIPERYAAMLASAPRPPAAQEAKSENPILPAAQDRYRLLVRGVDTIQTGDEFLQDDAVTWQPDPNGIFVGITYAGNVLLPARRAIEAAHGIKETGHGQQT